MPPRHVALRFLSGRHQGGVVVLEAGRALVLGRGPGVDLVLADDAVSRRHARVAADGDGVAVEDLGSTNGTYVNGARVTRARLGAGDRLLVGGSIARVVVGESPAAGAAPGERRTSPSRTSALQGRIEEIPLVDVLQLCASTRKSGTLVVENAGHAVEVVLHNGLVAGATLDARPELPPEKCLYRVLGWSSGRFELRQGGPPPRDVRTAASTEGLLMEAMRQLDELRRIRPTLPTRVAPAPQPPAGDLSPQERALVALAAAHDSVDAIIDAAPLTDLEAAEWLAALIVRGALVALA
jgi:Domain of unknown function (DUF4388)/Inner membrane component of T3SS, cytoplasmic domain